MSLEDGARRGQGAGKPARAGRRRRGRGGPAAGLGPAPAGGGADLQAAISRQAALEESAKRFNDVPRRASLAEWVKSGRMVVAETTEHNTSGVGVDFVTSKDEYFRSEYEANVDDMTALQGGVERLAAEIADGGHPDAAAVAAKLDNVLVGLARRRWTPGSGTSGPSSRPRTRARWRPRGQVRRVQRQARAPCARGRTPSTGAAGRRPRTSGSRSAQSRAGEGGGAAADAVEAWPFAVLQTRMDALRVCFTNQRDAFVGAEQATLGELAGGGGAGRRGAPGGGRGRGEAGPRAGSAGRRRADGRGVAGPAGGGLEKESALCASVKEFDVKAARTAS